MSDAAFADAAREIVDTARRASATQLVELLRVRLGTKPAVRLVVDDDEFARVETAARRAGLAIARPDRRLAEVRASADGDTFVTSVAWDDPAGSSFAVFLGGRTAVEACAAAESADASSAAIGRLLGIPACCARAYRHIQRGQPWLERWIAGVRNGETFDPYANHASTYDGPCSLAGEFLPCHVGCAATSRRGRLGEAAARAFGLGAMARECLRRARAPFIVAGEHRVHLVGAERAAGNPPEWRLAPAELEVRGPAAAELRARLAAARAVRLDARGVSVVEGRRARPIETLLAGSPPAVLLQFHDELPADDDRGRPGDAPREAGRGRSALGDGRRG